MMGWFDRFKSKKTEQQQASLTQRLGEGLSRTRARMSDLGQVFRRGTLDAQSIESLEDSLLSADVSIDTCQILIEQTALKAKKRPLKDALHEAMLEMLAPIESELQIDPTHATPFVILVVGVNGSGKTTTIGKLAKKIQDGGLSVLLGAGDTFRAAAAEQLSQWGARNAVPVVSQSEGSDPASVIFDAYQSAKAKDIDVLIADTAGRLQNQTGLMDELSKIKRVLQKENPEAPQEVLLVIDGTTGQNALNQVKQFSEAVGVTGIVITKLDGSARGGMIFTIANDMALPIRFIGVGENIDDLRAFEPKAFVDALLLDDPADTP